MKFDMAFATIREYGGKMKRMSFPQMEYFIDSQKNRLMCSNNQYYIDQQHRIKDATIYSDEILLDDWEVDLEGCWKDQ